jgi:hypothetical protein
MGKRSTGDPIEPDEGLTVAGDPADVLVPHEFEPSDEQASSKLKRKQAKAARVEHEVQDEDDLLQATDLNDTLENLRSRKAIVVLTLDRPTGEIEIDDAMATPAEVVYMLRHNAQVLIDAATDEDA